MPKSTSRRPRGTGKHRDPGLRRAWRLFCASGVRSWAGRP